MRCVLLLVEEFSEWDRTCQQCKFYKNCLNQEEKEKENSMSYNSDKTYGDNFPNHETLYLRLLINRERTELIQKLLNENQERITKDDIMDVTIDIEVYNLHCKKQRRKAK